LPNEPEKRIHYYTHVPGLGPVAVSRHAQARMDGENVSQAEFEAALFHPEEERPDGVGIRIRQNLTNPLSIVLIERPEPYRGAMLVKTTYRTRPQKKVS
jgi:hypothetical protein